MSFSIQASRRFTLRALFAWIPYLMTFCVIPTATALAADDAALVKKLYAENRVIEMEIKGANWDTLRMQEPNGGRCAWGFPGKRYDWFSFDEVIIDGVSFKDVGLRKKSWCGSVSNVKPAFNVSFDKYSDETGAAAKALFGTKDLVINNSIQDSALVRQCLGYRLFEKAGIPSSQCNFVHVTANGQDFGLYINVQSIKKDYLKRIYGSNLGNLYEVSGGNFDRPALAWFATDLDSFKSPEDLSLADITAVVDMLANPNVDLATIGSKVDLDQFMTYWAMELILLHNDGLSMNSTNSYLYFPVEGKMQVLPWGIDRIFSSTSEELTTQLYANNNLMKRLAALPEALLLLQKKINQLIPLVLDEQELIARLSKPVATVFPFVPEVDREKFDTSLGRVYSNMLNRRGQLSRIFVNRGKVHIESKAHPGICLNSQIVDGISLSNVWECVDFPDQVWDIKMPESGKGRVRNTASNNCLSFDGTVPEIATHSALCDASDPQLWTIRFTSQGYYQFESQVTPGLCLTLGSAESKSPVLMLACNGSDEQLWHLK